MTVVTLLDHAALSLDAYTFRGNAPHWVRTCVLSANVTAVGVCDSLRGLFTDTHFVVLRLFRGYTAIC